MKLKKIFLIAPLAAIVVATGCRKEQFNINKNLNSPTDSTVTFDVVLPAALHASGGIIANQWGVLQNWMGYWARSGTYAPNVVEETYEITTGFGNGIWNACYDNNYDYQIVQSKAAKSGATFYEGIARIMKAQNFQILVDVYGNVPYSAALKGGANPTPAYDKGLDIYKDLFRQIDTGISLIKNSIVSASNVNKNIWSNDIVFGDATATTYSTANVAAQSANGVGLRIHLSSVCLYMLMLWLVLTKLEKWLKLMLMVMDSCWLVKMYRFSLVTNLTAPILSTTVISPAQLVHKLLTTFTTVQMHSVLNITNSMVTPA
ncbi:MAG: SusD/RagB family nutrient-binding outer membrane lipoprotein [Chitinophagaceae bacterium]|nr:SusD/RagB family nutrient-binding outer membrane lipoprotein [Chitinophagaceae bacterium]